MPDFYITYHRKQRVIPACCGYRLTEKSQRKEIRRYKGQIIPLCADYLILPSINILFFTVNKCPFFPYNLSLYIKRNPIVTPVLINPVPPIHHASPVYCRQQEEDNNNDLEEPDRYERKEKIMEGPIPIRTPKGVKSSPPLTNPAPIRKEERPSFVQEIAIANEGTRGQQEHHIDPKAEPSTPPIATNAYSYPDITAAYAPKHLPQSTQQRPPSPSGLEPSTTHKGESTTQESPTSALALLISPSTERNPEDVTDFRPVVSESFTLITPIDPSLTDTPEHVKKEASDSMSADVSADKKVEISIAKAEVNIDGAPVKEIKREEMEASSSAGGESLEAVVAAPKEGAGGMWSSDRSLPVNIPHDTIKALIYGLFDTAERQAAKENWSSDATRTQIISNIRKICCDFPATYRDAENKLAHLATIINCEQDKIRDAQNEMNNATEVFINDPLRRLPYEEALQQINAIEKWNSKAQHILSGYASEAGAERARIVRDVLENVFVAADEMLNEGESGERASRAEDTKGKSMKGGRGRGRGLKKE